MNLNHLIACILLVFSSLAQAKLVGQELSYEVNGDQYKGYYVFDDEFEGPRPGVLVVHEWWGYNDYSRHRADMLAGLGYAAFALDMYGQGKLAKHPETAQKFMQEALSNPQDSAKRFDAATHLLKKQAEVKPNSIAAIGYCFGGAVVLNMARAGKDLKGVVSFHGLLATTNPAKPGDIIAKVAVYNGEVDPFVPAEQIAAFKTEMKGAGVDYRFVNLAGAKHGFTNPAATLSGQKFDMPLAYNKAADEASWGGMSSFLEEIFQ
jgi:dienelactone hydrolase